MDIVKKRNRQKIDTVLTMLLATLSVVIPLIIFNNLTVTFALYYLGMCIIFPMIKVLVIDHLTFKKLFEILGLSKAISKKEIYIGLIHGIVFFLIILAAYYIFKDIFLNSDITASVEKWGVQNKNKWIIVCVMILFNGIVEEIFWRGYSLGKLKTVLKPWIAIMLVTLFYTSYHMVTIFSFFGFTIFGLLLIIGIFSAGLIWGWMRIRYFNIWSSIIGHCLATTGYLLVYFMI